MALSVIAFPTLAATIGQDRGGNLADYLRHRAKLEASGEKVVIKGYCASACLVYTSLPNSCVYPGTKLMLHARKNASQLGAALYAARLPQGMAKFWLQTFGNRSNTQIVYNINARKAVQRGWDIRLCDGQTK